MRIVELRAENFKKLRTVAIRPDGAVVQITGANGAGKTSVLDAIWVALAGTRIAPAVPIRKGAEQAVIRLDLGELKVTRTFTLKDEGKITTKLIVEADDGRRFGDGQAVLNALVGEFSFDPLEFTRRKPADKFDALKSFVPGVDFDALAAADREDYDARTTANRIAKEKRAAAAAIMLPAGPVPARVDLSALERQLGDAAQHNVEIERRALRRQALREDTEALETQAEDLRERLKLLEARIAEQHKTLSEAEPLPAPIDVADVRARLEAGRQANAVADRATQRADLEAEALLQENASKALTRRMDQREADKAKAVAEASMPIRGLSFGDGVVLIGGVPFEQASDAEQLEASVAIAGAMNPKLRVIRVRDGSLMDSSALRRLEAYAEEHDLQVWVERVDTSGAVGFVLEDGELSDGPADEAF